MASLTGQPISASYNGILKTSSNTALTGTGAQAITDGDGNDSLISLSQSQVYLTGGATGNIEITGDLVTVTDDAQATGFQITAGAMDFAGNVDFSGATVTGLPGGAAGLVSGAAADSMQSASTLTTTAANAQAVGSIALGNNADAIGPGNVAIGREAQSLQNSEGAVTLGQYATTNWGQQVAIGDHANTTTGTIGAGSAIVIGGYAQVAAGNTLAIGYVSACNSSASNSVALGHNAKSNAASTVTLGANTVASASGAGAIGEGVTGDKANTVSMKALDLQTASTPTAGGIIMTDAGSTERRINLDASGNLLIDSTPVGGLTTVSDTSIVTETTTGADLVWHSVAIPAGTFTSGDMVSFRSLHKMEQSNGGFTYWSAWISNSTALLSGWSLGGGAGATSIPNTITYNKTIVIHEADGTGNGTDWFSDGFAVEQSNMGGVGSYADSIGRTGINWNNTVYINYQVYIDNAGNYQQHRGTTLTKINN